MALLAIFLCPVASAVELSDIVLPSEDELWEALECGRISVEQFIVLREIVATGIDPEVSHLLDEIPNLSYFATADTLLHDPLELDQRAGIAAPEATGGNSGRFAGQLRHVFYQQLEDDADSWYRSSIDLSYAERIHAVIRINREASGRERVVGRSLGYHSRRGRLRRLTLGSFTTRLGLGATFGYRGKLVSFADRINRESLAYPDYGGYNGLYLEATTAGVDIRSLASIVRDPDHRLVSTGASVRLSRSRFRPGLILGYNELRDRSTGRALSLPTLALLGEYRYAAGYTAVEIGHQAGTGAAARVGLVEGRHRFASAEIRYAGWTYADNLIDLTSGGKAGQLTCRDTLEQVGFAMSSRRSGQDGALVKSLTDLSPNLRLSLSGLLAANAEGDRRQQFGAGVIRKFGPRRELALSYFDRRRREASALTEDTEQGFRLEGRFKTAVWRIRSYIGYEMNSDEDNHVCLFAAVDYRAPDNSRYQVWTNFGEFDAEGLQYGYFYVCGDWDLVGNLAAGAKLCNSYRRERGEKHITRISMHLTATL